MTQTDTTPDTRYPRPGDRTRIDLPGTSLHHREGTITSLGPYATSVALDGEHGDERVLRNAELDFPGEAPDDPAVGVLAALREYVTRYAAFRHGDSTQDPGEPPVALILAACGEIERLRDEADDPINPED